MTKADEMRKMAAQNKKTKTEKVDDYEETLNIKQQKVQNLINKTLTKKVEVEKTLGMGNPYNYRNKAQYPAGTNKNGEKVFEEHKDYEKSCKVWRKLPCKCGAV